MIFISGCGKAPDKLPKDSGGLKLMTAVKPLAYVAEAIAGTTASVEVLIGPGQNPHSFEVKPSQIQEFARADAYFSPDLQFEKMILMKFTETVGKTVVYNIAQNLHILESGEESHFPQQHDEHADHAEEYDRHFWLAPDNLIKIAENIYDVLVEIDSKREPVYRANLAKFIDNVRMTDEEITGILSTFKGRTFLVYHPAFGYFAEAYGLHQETIETGGKSPSPRQLSEIISRARAEKIKVVFVQPQFDDTAARKIAESIGGKVAKIDPLEKDVLANLKKIANSIAESYGEVPH